jgi:REP element-mobilizing transposase RayT
MRHAKGGYVYHVLNRAVGRATLFAKATDYEAFVRVLSEALDWVDIRLLAYCVIPNHWHLVVWPQRDGDLSEFMRWLTLTHTQRRHAKHHTQGTGPLYQGRFKAFPVAEDEHCLRVLHSRKHCCSRTFRDGDDGGMLELLFNGNGITPLPDRIHSSDQANLIQPS